MRLKFRAAGEEVLLSGGSAELRLEGGGVNKVPLSRVIEVVRELAVRGLSPEALPDNVKWKVECGPLTVFVVELCPELRSVRWVSPRSQAQLGPEASYELYRLATPFVVLTAPFLKGRLQPRCELFYRNAPLRSLDDQLLWSNLLNVSPHSYQCTAWLCTQYLEKELRGPAAAGRRPGLTRQLDHLVKHLWGSGFNRSSEAHEGLSCFEKALREKVDPRVTDVERWQAESIKDPRFVLEVAWPPTGLTVGGLLERTLESWGVQRDLQDAAGLIDALMGREEGGDGHGA